MRRKLKEELEQANRSRQEAEHLCHLAKRERDRLRLQHKRLIEAVLSSLSALVSVVGSFSVSYNDEELSQSRNGAPGSEPYSSEETKANNLRMPSPAGMLDTPMKRRRRKANTGSPTQTGRPRARTSKASTQALVRAARSVAKLPRRSRSPADKPRKLNDRSLRNKLRKAYIREQVQPAM